jgi:hypothetical protein
MYTISAHSNANGLLEDLVSKDNNDIVYKKAKHALKLTASNMYAKHTSEYSTCMGYQSGVSQYIYLVSQSLEICVSRYWFFGVFF